MNQSRIDQITGVLRAVLPALLALLVGKGWLLPGSEGDITTAVVTFVAAAWSVYIHMPDRTAAIALANDPAHIVKAVAKLPEVKAINIEPTTKGKALAAAVGSAPDAVVTVAKPPPTPPKDK